MKHLRIPFLVALVINILTYGLLYYSNLQPALEIPFWDSICSILYCLLMLYALILSISKRKELFAKDAINRSCAVLLVCTSFPLILLLILTGQAKF